MIRKTSITADSGRARMHTPFSADTPQLCLNGEWKVRIFETAEEVPADWASYVPADQDRTLTVPGCFETQGIGKPIYTNIVYPFVPDGDESYKKEVTAGNFMLNAPQVPKKNLTVCYYREFEIPADWDEKQIFLNFEGVETCMILAVNGSVSGFSEDSKLDAEFNVTELVRPGMNRIAVQVRSFSAGSYLEDQDYWHLHGIYRPVRIFAKDPVFLQDFQVQTHFGENLREAYLDLRVWPNEDAPHFGENTVRVILTDAEGKVVLEKVSRVLDTYRGYLDTDFVMKERYAVTAPRLWSAERPYLYTLRLELLDPAGVVHDTASCAVGFREVRIEKGVLEVNRKRLIVRGTDLHECSAEGGRTVGVEELTAQLYAIKRLNFNAIRTSHYPKQHEFYDICDRIGLYVVDEANIETHGYDGNLSDDPLWLNAYIQRGVRMALRDKNHPSVIIWSLGNESGLGANHAAIRGWLKFYDDRPVQYESGGSPKEISDINCPMYPSREWIETCMEEDDRPFICCEYVYAKSNSNGNADMYWDLVRHYKRFQGGFLWDFIDKALAEKDADGTVRFRYAGAFGEGLKDRCPDMCLNGIVFADLEDKPAAEEMKIVQAPVYVKYSDWHGMFGAYRIFSEYADTDLSELALSWELICDGKVTEQGVFEDLSVAPGGSEILPLPYSREKVYGEAFFNFYVKQKEDTVYAPAGSVIYRTQIPAEGSRLWYAHALTAGGAWKTASDDAAIVVRYTDEPETKAFMEVVLDRTAPGIQAVSASGTPLFCDLKDRVYRAPTGIDEGQDENCYNTEWLQDGLNDPKPELTFRQIMKAAGSVMIHEELSLCEGRIQVDRDYLVTGKGVSIRSTVANNASTATLPRIGLGLTLPKTDEFVRWYGRGPHENYPDRKRGALVGLYEKTVDEMHEHYVRPCECGGHEDTRYLDICNREGHGLHVTGDRYFHFSVLPWSVEDYTKADYQEDLPESTAVHLCLDGYHAGLGGDTGWTKNIHPEYQLPKGVYSYRFDIRRI